MNRLYLLFFVSLCVATVYSLPLRGTYSENEDFAPPSAALGKPPATPSASYKTKVQQIHDALPRSETQLIPTSQVGTQTRDSSKRLVDVEDNNFDDEENNSDDFDSEEFNELEEDYVQPAKQAVANSSPSKTNTFKTSALQKTAIRVYKCPPNVPSYCPNAKVSELGPKGKNCEDAGCTINLIRG